MKRILVLFPKEWDRLELSGPEYAGRYEFVYAGFDLFRFPQNLRLANFDVFRFVGEVVARFRGERLDGVFSNNEYFGALIAAVVAEKLGLPGNDPRVVLTAQHKFYARKAFAEAAPEASPRFAAFPYAVRSRDQFPFELPCFVKPVKATFSVLARRIDRFDELRRHLSFWPFEKYIIKRLVKPFNDLLPWYTDFGINAHHMIAEELLPELREIPQRFAGSLAVRFAVLCWPMTEAGIQALCDRLRVPNEERELALLASRLRGSQGASTPGELLEFLKRADAFRRPERFRALLQAATLAQPGLDTARIGRALEAAAAVDAGALARRASAPAVI